MNIAIDGAEKSWRRPRRVQVDPTTVPLRTKRLRRLAAHVAGVDAEDGSPTAAGGKTWSFQGEKPWKIPSFNGKIWEKTWQKQEIPIFNGKNHGKSSVNGGFDGTIIYSSKLEGPHVATSPE